ncbi:hypothetical protein D3C72_1736710 [compost metagenome]
MRHARARHGLEQFARQVRGRAVAGGSHVDGIGVCLQVLDQVGHGADAVLVGKLGIQLKNVRHGNDQRDRHEILHRIVGQLAVDGLVDRMRADGAHQQGIAVGGGARGFRRADVAARARLVVHHHRLVPGLAQFRGHDARRNVGGAAGGEGHDDLHVAFGVVGVGLRGG